MKYRTIVADPPWEIGEFPEWGDGKGTISTPYPTMTLEDIKGLPVGSFAAPEAHLYLWTTVEFLRDAYEVAEAWGFEPMYPLHWCKPPRGLGMGGKFASNVEYVLFCRERHGSVRMAGWWLSRLPHRSRIPTWDQWLKLKSLIGFGDECDADVRLVNDNRHDANRSDTRWWTWPRGKHSAKPEAFLDLVEGLSPGPYLEMFARRNRLGWDTWGNESFEHVEMAA